MSPRKEHWITGKEAAALLTEQSGHEVKPSYVRFLAFKTDKLRHQPRDGRTEEYLESDLRKIIVRRNQWKAKEPRREAQC